MARRYHITEGAKTSAGGTVVSGSHMVTLVGKAIALEGDKIACPSCKSTGTIVCTGPRWPESFNGRTLALEGDLCACGCNPPPTLIAIQSLKFQTLDSEMVASFKASQINAIPAIESARKVQDEFDQHFQLKDEKGNSVKDALIDLHLADGRTVSHQTDNRGKTNLVNGGESHDIGLNLYQAGEK